MRAFFFIALIFFNSCYALDISENEVPIYKEIELSYNILNIHEAIENNSKFKKIKRYRRILHRKTSNNLWLKITLENKTSNSLERVLALKWDRAYFELYLVSNKKIIFSQNILNDNYIKQSNSFVVGPNSSVDLYLKVKIKKALDQFSYLYILDKNIINKFVISKERYYHHGLYFGILLTMAMYSFFMFFSIKEKGYLYLGLYQAWILIVTSDLYQYGFILLEDYPILSNLILKEMLSYSMMFFSIIFTKEFLNTKKEMPRLNLFLNIAMVLLIPLSLIHNPVDYSSFLYIVYVLVGIYAYNKKDTSALFYTLGFLGFTSYLVLLNLARLFDWNFYFEYLYAKQFFTCVESFSLTMALYLKICSIVKEREKALKEVREKERMMLVQSRFASMGEMLASIAHQWRQPLNHIDMILGNILLAFENKKLSFDYLSKKTYEADKQLKYMSNTIEDFTNFFAIKGSLESFTLEEVVKYSLELVDSRCKKYSIKTHLQIDSYKNYTNYKNELIQVIMIVLNNAIDALMQNNIEDRIIDIKIEENKIIISDNAGGIPDNVIKKIFDPYFSTKDKKFGTGLGLYTAKMIIDNLIKGKIVAKNSKNGASFTVKINKN